MATIGLQHERKLAERLSVDTDRAFTMLRDYARNTKQRLTDVARDVADGATAEFPPSARCQSHTASTREQRRHDAAIAPVQPQHQ